MRPKRRNDKIFVYINGGNKDMENKAGMTGFEPVTNSRMEYSKS